MHGLRTRAPVLAGAVAAFAMVVVPGASDAKRGRTQPAATAVAANAAAPMTFASACRPGQRIVIAGVGDLLFHDSLQRQALAPTSSFRRFFSGIESVLKSADITYGNLEGPAAHAIAAGGSIVKDPGRIVDGRVYGTSKGALIFNFHASVVSDLKATGFKVLSTANNHSADRGALGIDRTVDALTASGIAHTGTRRRTEMPGSLAGSWTAITEANGIRVAWLGCTYGTNGMPDRHKQVLLCYRDQAAVMAEIARASADPTIDAVILTPHWGLEGSPVPLKSDRAFAREAIEAGATAVLGTHPHVLQPWERIETADGRDGLVVYSTGNFVSNQQSAAQRSGIVVLLELVKPAIGPARISAAGFVPTWVDKQGNSGHRVIEMVDGLGEAATALKATLKLLPSANRVAANTFRVLPRRCPVTLPDAAPSGTDLVAMAPPLVLPTVAPEVLPIRTTVETEVSRTYALIAMAPPLVLPTVAPDVVALTLSSSPVPVDPQQTSSSPMPVLSTVEVDAKIARPPSWLAQPPTLYVPPTDRVAGARPDAEHDDRTLPTDPSGDSGQVLAHKPGAATYPRRATGPPLRPGRNKARRSQLAKYCRGSCGRRRK